MRSRLLLLSPVPVALTIALLSACGGREVSLGTNQTQLKSVDPKSITGTVPSCGAGAAHPNVCCVATPGTPSACAEYVGAPFHPCDQGYKTYPDPTSCCDLGDPANCAEPPPPPPIDAGPPPVCGYACPPGWYPIEYGCCTTHADGTGECYAYASGGGVAPGGTVGTGGPDPIDAGPAPTDGGVVDADADGGTIDAGDAGPPPPPPWCGGDPSGPPQPADADACPPPPEPPPPGPPPPVPPPPCDLMCPDGWQPATGAPDICCRQDPDGTFECFSLSTGPGPVPPPPEPIDAGPPTQIDAGAPRACYGSSGGDCGCSDKTSSGTVYAVDCSDTTVTCTCSIDGKVVDTLTNQKVCGGAGPDSVWAACGFPG